MVKTAVNGHDRPKLDQPGIITRAGDTPLRVPFLAPHCIFLQKKRSKSLTLLKISRTF
jgi:hypothetical protein